jgi:soluble lytic murein transglycosylase
MRIRRALLAVGLLVAATAGGLPARPVDATQEPTARAPADWRERFVAGLGAFKQADWQAAAREFSGLAAVPTPLAEYAFLFLGESLARLGARDEARAAALRAVEQAPGGRQVPQALLLAADQAAQAGDDAAAASIYRKFLDRAPDHREAVRARYALGVSLAAAGQAAEAVAVFRELWITAPASPEADLALREQQRLAADRGLSVPPFTFRERVDRADRLLGAGRVTAARAEAETLLSERLPVEVTLRALRVVSEASRRLGRYDQAVGAVERALKVTPPDRRAWWLLELARLQQRRGREAALLTVDRLVRDHPRSAEAAEALLLRGRILEEIPSLGEAEKAYLRAGSEFPDRDEGGAALWRSGWLAWLRGGLPQASERWSRLLRTKGGQGHREAAAYWLGRAHQTRGEPDGAERHFISLLAEAPRSYYGVLAAGRLGRRDVEPRAASRPSLSLPEDPVELVRGEPRFAKAVALRSVGLDEFADGEMEELARRANGDSARLYALSVALARDTRHHLSLRILRREFYRVARSGHPALPREFWELFYPLGWRADLTAAAARVALDPLLVAAVVREESSFDPLARSRVGARGLMQLMPDTARPMARQRRLSFQNGDLLDEPAINLELGSSFLAKLVRDFGEPRLAVAAYNAGPARVREWWAARRSDDLEVFVEQIPFNETRGFVKRVMLSWEEYRRLYGTPP